MKIKTLGVSLYYCFGFLPPDPRTINVLAVDEITFLFCINKDPTIKEITLPIANPTIPANIKNIMIS